MPGSSRHKPSKHGSRECSDSERDSSVKDHPKEKDESVVGKTLRDSGSSEKRKLDSKDYRTGKGEHSDDYGSLKRHRGARRNGGDSKTRRRDESEEVKKHRNSGRKESREGRIERSIDKEELRMSKQGFEYDNTDLPKVDELRSPELDNRLERRMRKKRDSGDGDEHEDDVGDGYDRRLSSRDEIAKDGRQKYRRRKDEKYRDKYREEMGRENKHQHDKQQDGHPTKYHTSIKSDDKHAREEEDGLEFRQKRTKLPESDHDQDQDHDLEFCEHEQHDECVHHRDYDLDRDHDYHRDRDWHWDEDCDHDRGRDCDGDHECDCCRGCDGSHVDSRSARNKDSRTKAKNFDDHTDTKSQVSKGQYPDGETKNLSSSRADSDVDRGRSQPRHAYADSKGMSNKHRSSPSSYTHIVKDEYRNANSEDPMYRDSIIDEPPQVESSFYGRTSQGNASSIPPPPAFRAALDRLFMGSLEDDVRGNSNTRYRRNSDPGFGREHGNSWRPVPNWTLPVSNGFVSFQPGPAHGGFQTMMPQFTSQPLFGVRPSMKINHAGISYHVGNADRFPGHSHPLGWQNVMDGPGPAYLHGWESSNGVFRDDPHMYGGSNQDRNRHSANSRVRKSGSETWKEQNGNSKIDLPSPAGKDESVPVQIDDNLTDQAIQVSEDDEQNEDKFHKKSPEFSHLKSLSEVPLNPLSATVLEKGHDSLTPSDNTVFSSRFYLSKLDISADLVIPELYDQYMCLVNVDKNASIDKDASAYLSQKDGSRAPKIYAATFSRHSPLPPIDNSILQRAIDIYNKHRVDLPNGGKVDIFSVSKHVQVDESIPISSLSAPASDGTEDEPRSTLEHKKLEALSPAKEHSQEIDQTCSQKRIDHEKQREPISGLCKKEDEVTFGEVNSGNAEEGKPTALQNESQLALTLHDQCDNINGKAKTTGFAHRADEKQGFGDTVVSSLIFEDGSPRTCDALMPGSIESESLILSRIHHSPENTQ